MKSKALLAEPDLSKRFGLYIHLPICKSRCFYCHFAVVTPGELSAPSGKQSSEGRIHSFYGRYLQALRQEIQARVQEHPFLRECPVSTLYLGGGTPSSLPLDQLQSLLAELQREFRFSSACELTLECNPDDLNRERVSRYRELGVTRLSLGIQSLSDPILRRIGRRHTRARALEAIRLSIESGFKSTSADLIFALPDQDLCSVEHDLFTLIDAGIDHLSFYCLGLEEPWRKDRITETDLPDEGLQTEMYLRGVEILTQAGLNQYEICNFARPGHESKHNLGYWNLQHYLGLGVGAHSCLEGKDERLRFWNPRSIDHYLNSPTKPEGTEQLRTATHAYENLFLPLRTTAGVQGTQWSQYHATYLDAEPQHLLASLVENGFVQERSDSVVLTPKGFWHSNSLFARLLPSLQHSEASL